MSTCIGIQQTSKLEEVRYLCLIAHLGRGVISLIAVSLTAAIPLTMKVLPMPLKRVVILWNKFKYNIFNNMQVRKLNSFPLHTKNLLCSFFNQYYLLWQKGRWCWFPDIIWNVYAIAENNRFIHLIETDLMSMNIENNLHQSERSQVGPVWIVMDLK